MHRSQALFVVSIFIARVLGQEASAAEPVDSFSLGFGGIIRTMPHCDANVYTVEYEHRITPHTALLGRASRVGYKFDDGNYREDGTLRGFDIGARYYPAGAMQGLFTGVSLGTWNGDWSFMHTATDQGRAHSNSVRLNFDFGDRIPIPGTSVSFMPQINIGKFFSSRSCEYTSPASMVGTSCTQKSEVNVYLFAGVAVGVAF